ncbi:MAG: hypothetical protein ACXW31_08905 [Thermoanaerobaculia bacterium]
MRNVETRSGKGSDQTASMMFGMVTNDVTAKSSSAPCIASQVANGAAPIATPRRKKTAACAGASPSHATRFDAIHSSSDAASAPAIE